MAGLFSTLDLASRALMVTQRGVAVTSHNISNVDTPGYTRQRQVLDTSEQVPALERSPVLPEQGQLRTQQCRVPDRLDALVGKGKTLGQFPG